MTDELEGLTDAQLVQRCAPKAWETWLERRAPVFFTGGMVLFAAAAACAARRLWGWSWGQAVVAGLVVALPGGVCGLVGLWKLVGARRRGDRAELGRRWMPPLEADLTRRRSGDRDWLLLLDAVALPHGGHKRIALELSGDAGRCELSALFGMGPIENQRCVRGETALSPDEAATLTSLMTSHAATIADVRQPRRPDGLPCQLWILDRVNGRISRGSCNFTQAGDAERHLGIVRIIEALLLLSRRIDAQPLVSAALSPDARQVLIHPT